MVELHSNFTASGTKTIMDGVLPTNHAEHETARDHAWLQRVVRVRLLPVHQHPGRWRLDVGGHAYPPSHCRSRKLRIAVGLSISNEIGYQRPNFSGDTWTWEIRPIVDKKIGKNYLAFNPTFDKSFHGPEAHRGSSSRQLQVQLRRHQEGRARPGILWRLGPVGLRPAARSATADRARCQYRSRQELGVQFRRGAWA